MHTNWNKTKGGSDVTTKLMDKNLAPLPFTNPETVAVNRLISILFVMIDRIHHAFTAKSHLPYPSLKHYSNAASHRSTYANTILRCYKFFKVWLQDKRLQPSTPPAAVRMQPIRRKINNAPVEKIDELFFNVAPPFNPTSHQHGEKTSLHTPKGLARKIQNGSAPPELIHLDKNCTGKPFYAPNEKQRCSVCKMKTNVMCLGCKQWFCFNKKQQPDMSDIKNFTFGVAKIGGAEKEFHICYFQVKHYKL
jgi:hypothetical protein